jgi:hypothetical protein
MKGDLLVVFIGDIWLEKRDLSMYTKDQWGSLLYSLKEGTPQPTSRDEKRTDQAPE